MRIREILIFGVFVLSFLACERFVRPDNDPSISTFNDDESHEHGMNCMDCHYSAGRGEGWFTAAGSVSGNTNKAIIELSDPETGALVKKIEVDQKHNFYTTEAIDFSEGLRVGIRNQNGEIKYMDSPITLGQCNLCHGASEESLSID